MLYAFNLFGMLMVMLNSWQIPLHDYFLLLVTANGVWLVVQYTA